MTNTGVRQKTFPHNASVSAFLDAVPSAQRREDAKRVAEMMAQITAAPAVLWGPTIVGFGQYAYTYKSGHSGVSFLAGFSPRAANLVVYLQSGFADKAAVLASLGKHKAGKGCLYLKRLSDINEGVLRALVASDVEALRARPTPE